MVILVSQSKCLVSHIYVLHVTDVMLLSRQNVVHKIGFLQHKFMNDVYRICVINKIVLHDKSSFFSKGKRNAIK